MNFTEVERKRQELLEAIMGESPPRLILQYCADFFDTVNQLKSTNLRESYFEEFREYFLKSLQKFNPIGLPLEYSNSIISKLLSLLDEEFFGEKSAEVESLLRSLLIKINSLEKSLNEGSGDIGNGIDGICFPVIEKYNGGSVSQFGLIDNLKVTIHQKNTSLDNFTVIPSYVENDEKLEQQLINSLNSARRFLGKYLKKNYCYDILVDFRGRYGEYEGDSVGMALTLGMIDALFRYHNLPISITFSGGICFTGAINEKGATSEIGERSIKAKVETIFNSSQGILVLPKSDLICAEVHLAKLTKKYPARKLELVGIKSFEELLDRRSIVTIRKINPAARAVKFLKVHYLAALVLAIFLAIISFFMIKEIDNNPYSLSNERNILLVKNSFGDILWSREMMFNVNRIAGNYSQSSYIPSSQMLIDLEDDGVNEVLLCNEIQFNKEGNRSPNFGALTCYDNRGNIKWQYVFNDSVVTIQDNFTKTFIINIIDVIEENSAKHIYCYANYTPEYPSAIFKLDISGNIDGSILWHPGHTLSALLNDPDGDGKPELSVLAINNGLDRLAFYGIDPEKLDGTAPANPNYRFLGKKLADYNYYILLPKSDVTAYYSERFNGSGRNSLLYFETSREFYISTSEISFKLSSINYYIQADLKSIKIDPGDSFILLRDSLISRGEINPPYTRSAEFRKLLHNQFEIWNGEKFTKFN